MSGELEEKAEFNLDIFVNKMERAPSLEPDIVQSHIETITAMRHILDNNGTTEENLNKISYQQAEWVFDIILYWPSCEISDDEVDWNHWGVQHSQLFDVISTLSRKESIKRKVTFI